MKRGIRILSLLLVLAMLAGMIPAVSAEPASTAGLEQTALEYEGTTGFGSLLAGELQDYQAQQNEDPTWISDVKIVDGAAWVDFALEKDATILIGIYDEETGEMVTSGNATADALDSYVSIELEDLPEYYELKVFVVDPQTYEPLCGAYTSAYYTRSMQELLALTVDDFDPEQVLNLDDSSNTNFAVYAEDTVVVYEDETIANRLTVSGNTYRFMMPSAEIKQLRVGDILVYVTLSGDIHVIKAARISDNRIEVTITADEDLELSDVFDYVKINTTVDGKTTSVDDSNMDEGVTYTGMETMPTRAMAAGEQLGTKVTFGFILDDVKLFGGISVSGSLALTLGAEFEYYLAVLDPTHSEDVNYVRLEMSYKLGATINIKGETQDSEVKLAEIVVMNICGVNFLVRPYFVASASAEVSYTLAITGTAGFKLEGKGFNYDLKNLYTKPKPTSELELEGTIFVGIKLVPAITVITDDVLIIDLSLKGGIEIKARLVGTKPYPDTEDHSCELCLDGTVRAKITLKMSLKLCKYISLLDITMVDYERFLCDFYLSFDTGDFGFGSCPNDEGALPSLLEGATALDSGTCGENLNWTFYDTNTLHITGYGLMYDYDGFGKEAPWQDYNDQITYVIIDEGAESIGAAAFNDCDSLFSVTLPNSLMYVERYAFAYCTSLEEIELPEGVEYIEEYAFAGCTALTHITLGDGLEHIYQYAFNNCSALQDLRLPTGLERIGQFAFKNCSELETVDFPYTLIEIGNSAFLYCSALKEVDLPDRLETLGEDAFQDCTALERLYIGDGLTELQNATFYNCTSLKDVWLGNNMEIIGYSVFWNCVSLEEIEIPDSVTLVDGYAFISCDKLSSVDFGDHVESIGYGTFKNCPKLTNVELPDSLTYIGKFAFENCTGLSEVRLSPNLETINTGAFINCTSLEEIELPDSLTELEDEAFMGCTSLHTAVIGDGLTEMGSSVFYECTDLRNVTIGAGLTAIGSSAFWNCDSLTSISIPGNITSIGKYAFTSCDNLRTVTLHEGLLEVSYEAFNNCAMLDNVTLPSTLTRVGNFAFSGCEGLNTVRFTGNAPEFEDESFEDVTATVYYPSNRSGWTADILQDYDGELTWVPYTVSGTSAVRRSTAPASLPEAETRAVTLTSRTVNGLSNSARYLLVVAKSGSEPLLAPSNLVYAAQFISDKNGSMKVNWSAEGSGYYTALYGEDGVTVLQGSGGTTPPQDSCTGGASCPSKHFTDVPPYTDWAHAGIDFAVSNQLFNGMSSTSFGPNISMNRAMLVTVLWRYAGSPIDGTNTFTDVEDGEWYTQAIAWAAKNGIVSGIGNNKFNPNGIITREQMAAILYRYAGSIGIDTDRRANLSTFPDNSKVSPYAVDALQWAVAEDLIKGVGVNLQPQGNATRAQVATILMRFIQNVVNR